MRLIRNLLIAFVLLGSVAVPATATLNANAQETTTTTAKPKDGIGNCKVEVIGTENTANKPNSKFTFKNDIATAKVKVSGKNCSEAVTLAAWEVPTSGTRPLSNQRLANATTKVLKAGTWSISVKTPTKTDGQVPGCLFQADLVRGNKADMNPKTPGAEPYGKERLLGFLVEGTKKCDVPDVEKIQVCELATKKIIWIKETNFDPAKHSKDLSKCDDVQVEKIQVCELATKKIIWINEDEYDATKHSTDLSKCDVVQPEKIQVCELATKQIIWINEDEYDATKHSTDLSKCETDQPDQIQVCELATKKIIWINEDAYDATKHTTDLSKCDVVQPKQIQVCELATKSIVWINEDAYDATKHTTDLSKCNVTPPKRIQVCEMSTKSIVWIDENQYDSSKYTKDLSVCNTQPEDDEEEEVLGDVTELSKTGPGAAAGLIASSVLAGTAAHRLFRSRRFNR